MKKIDSKIFEILWVDGSTSLCEGKDAISAIINHFGEFYLSFYKKHKEIMYIPPIITNNDIEFVDLCS